MDFEPKAQSTTKQGNNDMKTDEQNADDSAFGKVVLGSDDQYPCSPPEPDPFWRGIVIKAPRVAALRNRDESNPQFPRVPICGYYMLVDSREISEGALEVVAIDVNSKEVYRGRVVDEPDSDEMPPPDDGSDPTYNTVAFGGYFNINLARYVKLPGKEATYDVSLQWADEKSNVVRIQLR